MEENNKIIAEFMNFPKITNVRDSESGKYYDYWLPNNFNLILEQEIQIESNNGWGLVHQDCVFVRDLIFHSDWNWLMEVVEKIESIKDSYHGRFGVYISSNSCTIQSTNFRPDKPIPNPPHYYDNIVLNTKIESTYYSVLNFINFYNKQKEE